MARRKKSNGYIRRTFTFDGKRYSVYGKTAREAVEKEANRRKVLEEGQRRRHNPTLFEYYEDFTAARRHEVKENTLHSEAFYFKIVANENAAGGKRLGDFHMSEITRRDVEHVRESLLAHGLSPQTINQYLNHLGHVFRSAVLDDTIIKSPCIGLKALKRTDPPATKTKHRALTEEETRYFFDAASQMDDPFLNLFKLMIHTGMRLGEAAALYPADIDRLHGFIHIQRTLTRNQAGKWVVGQSTKTSSGMRDIPLTDEAAEIIHNQQGTNALLFEGDLSGLLFRSVTGGAIHENNINQHIRNICKAAGIDPFTSHAFRDTYATRFIEQRPGDFKILSELLGHSNTSITLDLYTHAMVEKKVEAAKAVAIKTS